MRVVQPRFFSHFREVQQYFSELGLPKGMLEILPGITQARVVAQGGLCASILEIVRDTIPITIHNLIKEMYDWSGWHVGTGSRMMSCTAEARVEGRRHSHHPSHHQQGDGRVRVQVESVLGRFTLPSTTFHRHPHCTCVTQRAPYTGTSTYARKSWGGLPRCDLAPQSTSFGTVALRERQHLAMTATCPEGEAWAASRNWNHGTHFLWDPRAAPTFHPPSTLRHRTQCSTCHLPRPHSIHYSWVASDTMSLQWL